MNLKEFKKRTGIKSLKDLADMIGEKRSTVYAWSAGKRTPTFEMCAKLLEVGMTVEELFGKPYLSSVKESHLEFETRVENAMKSFFEKIGKI